MTVSKMFLTVASVVKVWSGLGRFLVKVNERLHSLENRKQTTICDAKVTFFVRPTIDS